MTNAVVAPSTPPRSRSPSGRGGSVHPRRPSPGRRRAGPVGGAGASPASRHGVDRGGGAPPRPHRPGARSDEHHPAGRSTLPQPVRGAGTGRRRGLGLDVPALPPLLGGEPGAGGEHLLVPGQPAPAGGR